MSKLFYSSTEILRKLGGNVAILRKDPQLRTKADKRAILAEWKSLEAKLEVHLKALAKRNTKPNHINYKIYYLLAQPFTYINAYAKISKNKGALTKGIKEDDEYIRSFGLKQAYTIADTMKKGTFQFSPVRRVEIPKPGKPGKMRPIDTPTQKDRIVQEALRGILEAIYEPQFRKLDIISAYKATNTGFRPGFCTWDNMEMINTYTQTCNWCIEGDIVGAYNNVNHKILLTILNRRIRDSRFLSLMDSLLKSGIMHDNVYINSLTGTPQGGIVSPLLFNIYMFEFDQYVHSKYISVDPYKKQTNKSKIFQNRSYARRTAIKNYSLQRKNGASPAQLKLLRQRTKDLKQVAYSTPSKDSQPTPHSYFYSRYADDWIFLFRGTYAQALAIRQELGQFINCSLKLTLDKDKTLIAPYVQGFCFLGFQIAKTTNTAKVDWVLRPNKNLRYKTRTRSDKILIRPDGKRILEKLRLSGFARKKKDLDSHFPVGKLSWSSMEEFKIVERYKAVCYGICNYYRFCKNPYILNRVSYILQYSCAKTISARRKTTMGQVFSRYGKDLSVTHTFYQLDKSYSALEPKTKHTSFITYTELKQSFKRKRVENAGESAKSVYKHQYSRTAKVLPQLDPFRLTYFHRTKMKIFSFCVICSESEGIEHHHINSLQSIPVQKRLKFDYIRSRFNRLQVPVCRACHQDLTFGKYSLNYPLAKTYDDWIAKL